MNKKVWILWMQGLEDAPKVVKVCVRSWKYYNPSWDIVFLDKDSLRDYDALGRIYRYMEDLPVQKKANLIRLNLLASYGGVWADATCLCRRGLDSWIGECVSQSGFFAFARPGPDRLLSNWFIASTRENKLMRAWAESYNSYFRDNTFGGRNSRMKFAVGHYIIRRLFEPPPNPWLSRVWNTSFVKKWLNFTTYYSCHYVFADVVYSNPEAGSVWKKTPKVSADGPHRLQMHGLLRRPTSDIRKAIREKKDPVYKLNWSVDSKNHPRSTLSYVLSVAKSEMSN